MPPAAMTGTGTASAICGTSAKADFRGDVGLEERAAMTSGLRALGDDGVNAPLGKPDGFLDARGRAQDFAADSLDAGKQIGCRQAEMKARDRRPQLFDQGAGLFTEGLQTSLQRERRRSGAKRGVVRRKTLQPGLLVGHISGRGRMAKEVEVDGLVALRPELGQPSADLVGREHGARERAEAAGLRHGDRHLDPGCRRHGRLHDGQLDAK